MVFLLRAFIRDPGDDSSFHSGERDVVPPDGSLTVATGDCILEPTVAVKAVWSRWAHARLDQTAQPLGAAWVRSALSRLESLDAATSVAAPNSWDCGRTAFALAVAYGNCSS
jgi:hypothetical protein